MAARALHITISSPLRPTVELDASEVVLPGSGGIFTVLAGHTPLLTTLTKGALIVYQDGKESRFFAVHDGFAEVLNDRIAILADVVESAEEIDLARAKEAEQRSRERLRKRETDVDLARVEAALARSLARQQAHARQAY